MSAPRDLQTVDESSFPYIFAQNVSVPLKSAGSSNGVIRCNVYRPKSQEKTPVLITYGPYGKDIPYKEYGISGSATSPHC